MSTELERISSIPADVLVAYDGAEALRFLDGPGPSPDLIVLDLSLPRFGGLEILRRHPPTDGPPPVVVFTGSSNLEERARAMELGASDYVVKPDGWDDYLAAIRDVLERWVGIKQLNSDAE